MEKLVVAGQAARLSLFQSSEIYGGLGSVWDYGRWASSSRKTSRSAGWRSMVHDREDIEGLDAAI